MIHADVTPSNILVGHGTSAQVKLLDFGLAELHECTIEQAATGFIMGTPRYVAPEQLHGHRASEASDQYALGIVMFEMIAGAPPFTSPNLNALCRQHIYDAAPDVVSPIARLAPELVAVVARCLAKSPHDRFPSMGDLLAALEAIADAVTP